MPILNNKVCEGWHRRRGINIVIFDEMVCAGYEYGGRDSCQVSLITFLAPKNIFKVFF